MTGIVVSINNEKGFGVIKSRFDEFGFYYSDVINPNEIKVGDAATFTPHKNDFVLDAIKVTIIPLKEGEGVCLCGCGQINQIHSCPFDVAMRGDNELVCHCCVDKETDCCLSI
jgi:hypothetical protein